MPKPLSFTVERRVGASRDAVWEVLGDFGTEHRWTKSLEHCERDTDLVRVGTIRTCTLPKPLMGRTSVREQVTEYEPGQALAYLLEGSAGPVSSAARQADAAAADLPRDQRARGVRRAPVASGAAGDTLGRGSDGCRRSDRDRD